MGTVDVACGLVFKEEKILLAKRLPHKTLGGFWEFPGGKIEAGEDVVTCLKRELNEELGMNVKVIDIVFTNVHEYGFGTIKLIAYLCVFVNTNNLLVDHDEVSWVPLGKVMDFNLSPADVPIAKYLIDNERNIFNQLASLRNFD